MPINLPESISDLFAAYGLPETDDTRMQFSYFMQAMAVYAERDRHHGSLWKKYGIEDCMLHVRSKAARLEVDPATHEDDGIDLLNYTVFALRLVRDHQ